MMEREDDKKPVILTCECMDHKEVKVELNLLEKVSEYFERLRTSGLKEMKEQRVCLTMFSSCDIQSMVDFAMSGSLNIKDLLTDTEKMLHLADYFRMYSLQEFCKSAMQEELRKSYTADAFALDWAFNISLQYQLGMENLVVKICAENIDNVHLHTGFSNISVDFLYRVVQNPNLHVKTEVETLNIMIRWCGENLQKLQQNSELYNVIHIPSVTNTQLEYILNLLNRLSLFEFSMNMKEKHKI